MDTIKIFLAFVVVWIASIFSAIILPIYILFGYSFSFIIEKK